MAFTHPEVRVFMPQKCTETLDTGRTWKWEEDARE